MPGPAHDLDRLVLASCDRLRTIITAVTRHHDELQRIAARLDETGAGAFEPESLRLRALASSLDLVFNELARQRAVLAKAAGGGPRDLRPATGEHAIAGRGTKKPGGDPHSGG